jgi:D-alanyl-D-alanine dipeptidase
MIKDFKAFIESIDEALNGMLQPSSLSKIEGAGSDSTGSLNSQAAKDYERMKAAAEADGITWKITSSYRDYENQVKTASSKGLYSQGGLAAVPGTSNHGWGSALDLDLSSDAQDWLEKNAADYGFSTIAREPWHWEHKASVQFVKSASELDSPSTVLIDADLINRLICKKGKGCSL